MNTSTLFKRLGAALLVLFLLGQAWSLRQLRAEISDLKRSIPVETKKETHHEAHEPTEQTPPRDRAARRIQGAEAPPSEPASPPPRRDHPQDEEALERTIEQAITRRERQQRERKMTNHIAMVEESSIAQLEAVAESHDLTEDQQEMALQVILSGLEQGMDLRVEFGNGTMTVQEAKAEGALIKEETADGVTEILGEEAAEALFVLMEEDNGR